MAEANEEYAGLLAFLMAEVNEGHAEILDSLRTEIPDNVKAVLKGIEEAANYETRRHGIRKMHAINEALKYHLRIGLYNHEFETTE